MGAHLLQSSNIDLSDNATFARGFPHDHFTWAREHAPIYWHEPTAVTADGEGILGDEPARRRHGRHAGPSHVLLR